MRPSLFINGRSGLTKYYVYGRYDPQGLGAVKNRPIPNALIREGRIEQDSLRRPLHEIAVKAGQSGRIQGVYIEVERGFAAMLESRSFANLRTRIPRRRPDDLLTHSCVHFVKDVVAAAGIDTRWMLDPRRLGAGSDD